MTQPTQLGRYKLESHLGSGAFADVYKASDQTLKRVVALKVLKPTLVSDPESFARFIQEAQVAAGLFHPHIATVLDMGEAEGRYFIAMRYIDGLSLDKVLAQDGPFSWQKCFEIISQVGQALDFAHENGLVHRDVKPQNIILDSKGNAVLTDFGLVRALASSGMTSTGSMLGTPAYMAPEIWQGEDATPATDQYALACVLVEMLTGRMLFEGKTSPAVMMRHFQPLSLPAEWPSDVPKELNRVLERALLKEMAERFETLAALLGELLVKEERVDKEALEREIKTRLEQDMTRLREEHESERKEWEAREQKKRSIELRDPAIAEAEEALKGVQKAALEASEKADSLASKPDKKSSSSMPALVQQITPDKPAVVAGEDVSSGQKGDRVEINHATVGRLKASTEDNPAGIEWVEIPAGEFIYGKKPWPLSLFQKPEERHLEAFLIGKYPVTNAQYKLFLDANLQYRTPKDWDAKMRMYPSEKANHPVVCVSRNNAQAFCQWANCRLLTEVEWEKAARGEDGRSHPWGEEWVPGKHANSAESGIKGTSPVDGFPAGVSPYGIWDMSGNVWEWTDSNYDASQKVLRGGSWYDDGYGLRAANRDGYRPGSASSNIGFRCARSL